MRFRIEDIEDQIIATLQADATLKLGGVTIRAHAGDVNVRTFMDPAAMEGFVNTLPFIFVQYQGKSIDTADAVRGMYVFRVAYRLYIGARSLRAQTEAQRSAYSLLRNVYDDLHGKVPLSSPQKLSGAGSQTGILLGTAIDATTTGFNPQSPFMIGGSDEKLIVNLPEIVVYSADYIIRLQA